MRLAVLLFLFTLQIMAQVPQPQVPMSGKIGPGGNFPLFNGGTVTMPADADYTLVFPEFTGSVLQITSSVPLTATRNIIHTLPSSTAQRFGFEFTVQNATQGGKDIVFKGNSGTGVTIPNGQTMAIIFDGTNYVSVGVAGTGSQSNEIVFQGVSDAVRDDTCSTTSGSNQLTCSDAPFPSPCPNLVGKTVSVTDGLSSTFLVSGNSTEEGHSLITTIQSCSSSSVAVMAKSATRTNASISARWGTDNGPALIALANAPSTAGKVLKIPPGNYLVQTTEGEPAYNYGGPMFGAGHAIDVYSNTTYEIMFGAHIYWVGPLGCDARNPACSYKEQGFRLFYLHDVDYWTQSGTHNVHIKLDGIVEGDNSDNNGVGVPYLNQSAFAYWVGIYLTTTTVTDITIDGIGSLVNLYGFSVHGISGQNTDVRGIRHKHVAKGLNVNGHGSDQSFNSFLNSAGIEACGSNITVVGNRFDNTWGISVGGIGQMAECGGYVVSGNVFTNMHGTNLDLSQCPVGAVVTGNSFDIPPRLGPPVSPTYYNPSALSLHDASPGDLTPTRDNLIIGNTFKAEPGDGVNNLQCFAAVSSGGSAVGGNVFSNNHMTGRCLYGYILDGYFAAQTGKPNIVRGDTLDGQNGDLNLGASSQTELQGAILVRGGIGGNGGVSRLTPDSWYTTPSGVQFGKVTVAQAAGVVGTSAAARTTKKTAATPQRPAPAKPNPKPKLIADPPENDPPADPPAQKPKQQQLRAPLSAPPAFQRTKPPFTLEQIPPFPPAGEPPPAPTTQQPARAGRTTAAHSSAFRVVSPNTTNYLDINVPDSGNPSISSSTGTITVSGLTGGGGGLQIPQSEGVLIVTGPPPPIGVQVGYPTVGASTQDLTSASGTILIPFVAPSNATVHDCNVHIGANITGSVFCWLYDSDGAGGRPNTLLCNDTTGTSVTANGWNQITSLQVSSCPALVANHTYFVGFMVQGGPVSSHYDTITFPGGTVWYTTDNQTGTCCTARNPLSSVPVTGTANPRSIYLTLIPAAGAAPAGARAVPHRTARTAGPRPRTGTYSLDTTLGTGYLHFDGTNYSWDVPQGLGSNFTAGGDLSGTASTQQVIGIRSKSVPALSSGYLRYDGNAFLWDTPSATIGSADLGGLSGASKANDIENGAYQQIWRWAFTGSSLTRGLLLTEGGSVNPSATLLEANTLPGAATVPFKAIAHSYDGLQVAANGDIQAVGAAKFVGPVQLPIALADQVSLGTDHQGNIIAGSGSPGGGAPKFPVATVTTSSSPVAGDFAVCRTFNIITSQPFTITLPTPAPPDGECIWIIDTNPSQAHTISGGGLTINGLSTFAIGTPSAAAPAWAKIISNGSAYVATGSSTVSASTPGLVYSTPITVTMVANASTTLSATTLVTPTSATNYRLDAQIKQITNAACTTFPTMLMRLTFTDADSNTLINMSTGGLPGYSYGGTVAAINQISGAANPGIANTYFMLPINFSAAGSQAVTLTLFQNTAGACTTFPTFMVRPLLYAVQ